MLRVALVGCGGMARTYRSVYSKLPNVEFVLAVDPNEEALAACRELGVKKTSSNFEDALVDGIDMIDISTPNFMHEPQAVGALNAGKHVLLQKPMSNSVEGAGKILAAAGKSEGVLGMYMSSYTNPAAWEIKKIVAGGHLGKIQSIRARDAHRGGLNAKPDAQNWRGSRERTGGGSFVQLSIHAINLVQWWLDSQVTDIFAYSANQYCPQIGGDDITVSAARFGAGYFGVFESGWASEGSSREIFGTTGHLQFVESEGALNLKLDKPYRGELVNYDQPGKLMQFEFGEKTLEDVTNPLNQHRMFVEAVQGGKKPHMSGREGLYDLAVVTAAYASADVGKPISVATIIEKAGA